MTGINTDKLYELIKSFYCLTGIKVAVYNTDFEEVIAYPEENCHFCCLMQKNEKHNCDLSTKKLCTACAVSNSLTVHKCHAGLTEVAAPLSNGVSVIGYVMFGQITTESNKEEFLREVKNRHKNLDDTAMSYASEIPHFSDEHIKHVSDVTNAIASYIIFSQLVYETDKPLVYKINEYINSNLEKDLSVSALCDKFFISKSALYKITDPFMPEGIAAYIKKQRINKAAELLLNTDESISDIAEKTGFKDVNYFQRIFKKEKGFSASSYRKFDYKL